MTDRQQTFWVIGYGTTVGKSAMAGSLLRVLGGAGRRTLGFKPVSAVNFFTSIDSLEAMSPGHCISGDTGGLLEASTALVDVDLEPLVETANPLRLMFFHDIRELLMVRVGSHATGNHVLYRGEGPGDALARSDVQDLMQRKQWLESLQPLPVSPFGILQTHREFPEAVQSGFDHLMQFNPDTVVCEGSSRYLPVWQGQPAPDHLLVVRQGWVDLFTGVHPRILDVQRLENAPTGDDLNRYGKSLIQKAFRQVWPVARSEERQACNDHTVRELLRQAGLLPGAA